MTIEARRHCPSCGVLESISEGQRIWPRDWKCSACGHVNAERDGITLLAPALNESDEGMDRESFAGLAEVEEGHFWFVSRNELIRSLVEEYAPSARRILEIGCGTGFVLYALREAAPSALLVGSELHTHGLEVARKRHGDAVELFQMDARWSGLSDVFDVVGAFDVLEHIPEDGAVLAEIYRMLKPGGAFFATVPQHEWLWSATDDIAHHQRRYRPGELARKAEGVGFKTAYQTSFITLLMPFMMVSRISERLRGKRDKKSIELEEFRMPKRMNDLLTKVCRVESRLRETGIRFPFGGSQVVVARKPE